MKACNLFTLLVPINDTTIRENYIKQLIKFEGYRLRNDELNSIKCLIDSLNLSKDELDNWYYSYHIPQIGKEFDLLKFDDKIVVNIEVKANIASERKVLNQLKQNKHYISSINRKEMYFFSYVNPTNTLYELSDDKLKKSDMYTLEKIIKKINLIKNQPINDLFHPSKYLISPFNKTEKFIESKYFLTQQQEEIKRKIDEDDWVTESE